MPWCLFGVLLLLPSFATSQFELGGNYTEDAVLDAEGSPYNVNSTIFIHPNATLFIEAGVELYFQLNVGVVVGGSLIANGTETERIKFSARTDNKTLPIGYHQIRLTGGPTPNEGRLEVFFNGEWGTVCDDYWDSADSQVACRQLGYHQGTHSYSYRYGTGPIWLDQVQCTGSELVLWDCSHRGIGVHSCGKVILFI